MTEKYREQIAELRRVPFHSLHRAQAWAAADAIENLLDQRDAGRGKIKPLQDAFDLAIKQRDEAREEIKRLRDTMAAHAAAHHPGTIGRSVLDDLVEKVSAL